MLSGTIGLYCACFLAQGFALCRVQTLIKPRAGTEARARDDDCVRCGQAGLKRTEGISIRLFTAINFDEKTKAELYRAGDKLLFFASGGSFTHPENLHLTLAFIGETDRADAVCQAMNRVSAKPFLLATDVLGRFRRDSGDIWWLGFAPSDSLSNLYAGLYKELVGAGFSLETRSYRPHLTLGRQVVFPADFDEKTLGNPLPKMSIRIDALSLMKSERIGGRLTYTEIYRKALGEEEWIK